MRRGRCDSDFNEFTVQKKRHVCTWTLKYGVKLTCAGHWEAQKMSTWSCIRMAENAY